MESAVASAVASAAARTGTGRSTSPVAVRVDAIGGGDAADDLRSLSEHARTLWARRNDALAKGVRWMASVAPPEPYFLDAYLRDEVRDALANGGTLDAAATTPAACVDAWNDAVESVRARLASAGASVAPSGFAAEFADADTPGAFLRRRGLDVDLKATRLRRRHSHRRRHVVLVFPAWQPVPNDAVVLEV